MRIELSKPVALNALYGTNKWGSEYIKVGPTRGERVAKYNRLMRIEEKMMK